MSLKKTVAVAAAAGALAAIAVPAMAFENEFNGTYTFNSIFSNFDTGNGGNVAIGGTAFQADPKKYKTTDFLGWGADKQMNNYFEQRARLRYTAKASDDLKLVTHFELDTRFGGTTDGKYSNTSDSGVLDADGVTLETKWVYLDFNVTPYFNVKTGVMPYKDTLKGILLDADVPAIATTTKLGNYTLGTVFSRFNEAQQTGTPLGRLGDRATDFFAMDNTYAFNKDTKAALSYYFMADYKTANQALLLNTFGLSGQTKIGALDLSGFMAYQAGHQKHSANGVFVDPAKKGNVNTWYHGWAANVAAKAAVGPGTVKTAFLYVSGNNETPPTDGSSDNTNRGWQSPLNSYNEANMMIVSRGTQNSPTTTDNYIRKIVTNMALLTVGYDANLTSKLFLNTNIGCAWAPASGDAPVDYSASNLYGEKIRNGGDYMGTEFNTELGYKLYSNLTLQAQAAYFLLGGYYKNSNLATDHTSVSTPENPYMLRLQARFSF